MYHISYIIHINYRGPKNLYHSHLDVVETKQLICKANHSTGFYTKRAPIKRHLGTDHTTILKINESWYIAFAVSVSIKKLFSIDYVNIYLFSLFFSIDFPRWKSVGLPHIAYIMIY